MLAAGDARDSNGIPGYEAARDYLGLDIHGLTTTHVDALSHMFVRGEMYGGRPASDVRSDGARSNTVMSMADGVVGRGVLLDVPAGARHRLPRPRPGSSRSPTSRPPRPRRTSASGAGDILLVAWGRDAAGEPHATGSTAWPGCTRSACRGCTNARSRCSAATASPTRCRSWASQNWPFPVHQVGITGMGLHLIDNMAAGPALERVRGRRAGGRSCSRWPAAHRPRHGLPGQPGRGPVSDAATSCAAAALGSGTPAPSTHATSTPCAALFHPDAAVEGARGSQSIAEWLDTMRGAAHVPDEHARPRGPAHRHSATAAITARTRHLRGRVPARRQGRRPGRPHARDPVPRRRRPPRGPLGGPPPRRPQTLWMR